MNYINIKLPLMILKPGFLNSASWLNFKHFSQLKYPLIKVFRGSALYLSNQKLSFLNSNGYWVFVFPDEPYVLKFLDYIQSLPKKPKLLTLVLNGSFFNFTTKIDPYAYLSNNLREKRNFTFYFNQQLTDCLKNVIFFSLHMTYILLLSIVLLIQYLWSICDIFIKHSNNIC